MQVIHGPNASSGQANVIVEAQQEMGVDAESVSFREHPFQYDSGELILSDEGNYSGVRRKIYRYLVESSNADIFHFYGSSYFVKNKKVAFPWLLDLLTLRACNKVTVFHFRGCEVRMPSVFKVMSPYHYVDEPFYMQDEYEMVKVRNYIEAVCHQVLVPDPELLTYVPNALIVNRAINLKKWNKQGPSLSDNPLIIHAPSHREKKGTHYILSAIQRLRNDGLQFRFEMVENMDHQSAKRLYEQADIVVDQLRIGWYGVFAVEAMALGKPVVTYIREDLVHHLPDELPLANANPDSVESVLRELIQSPEKRQRLGNTARGYVETHHCSLKIAKQLKAIYEDCQNNPKPVDIAPVLDFMAFQEDLCRRKMTGLKRKNPIFRFKKGMAELFKK